MDKQQLLRELMQLRESISRFEQEYSHKIKEIHPRYGESAKNLLHYLALRQHDLRPLQDQLAILGLSSLGRAESHVLANLDTVCNTLHELAHSQEPLPGSHCSFLGLLEGRFLLRSHTEDLLGSEPPDRGVRIMVTMGTEAAEDPSVIRELVKNGMNCMRINCAHDHVDVWSRMIAHLKRPASSSRAARS